MTSSPIIFTTRPPPAVMTSKQRFSNWSTTPASSASLSCWLRAVNPTRSAKPTTPISSSPDSTIEMRRRAAACRWRRHVASRTLGINGRMAVMLLTRTASSTWSAAGGAGRLGPAALRRLGRDEVGVRRGHTGDGRADDPAELEHDVGADDPGVHHRPHLGEDLDVGVGEGLLARPGLGVAERPPDQLDLVGGQAGPLAHLVEGVDAALGRQQLLDRQQGERAVLLGVGDLLLGGAEVAQQALEVPRAGRAERASAVTTVTPVPAPAAASA